MGPTTTTSGEVAQMLTSATSNQRLNREVWAALLRVRTRPEGPEGNMRELTRDSIPNHGIAREQKKGLTNIRNFLRLSRGRGVAWVSPLCLV